MNVRKAALVAIVCLLLAGSLAVLAGCSQGKPQVIIFLGKSSSSFADVNAMVAKAEKKFGNKVTFKVYDYDNAASKSARDKYHVSMNPTIIITNAQGQVKQTYMGKPMEDDLLMSIQSFIPGAAAPSSSSAGTLTQPGTPFPPGSSSSPQPVPITPGSNQ